jgi:hypothetical protein
LVRPMDVAMVHIDDAITVGKKRAVMHKSSRAQMLMVR